MVSKLVGEEGFLKELTLPFDAGDQWLIGRDPDECQLLIEDSAVSRKHILVRRTPDGFILENVNPKNPVFVNDEEITQPYLLHHGDGVKIGNTLFRFYAETEAQLFDTTPKGVEVPSTDTAMLISEPAVKEREPHTTLFGEEMNADMVELAQVNFDLLDTGRWLLKVIGGPNSGAEFAMQAGSSYLIGTDPNTCDIVFYDTSVSRQHARITVANDNTLQIEDLKSRNGTHIEGEAITGSRTFTPNTVVSVGTTSFVVYDREGEMQTIISPLMPSILRALQQKESETKEAAAPAISKEEAKPLPPPPPPPKQGPAVGTLILMGVVIGLFVLAGLALQTLFFQEPVEVKHEIDPDKILGEELLPFPSVRYSFNKATGRLLLVGHVSTGADKSQLLYNLQGLDFIKDLDDSDVIIDEYVSNEANQLLGSHPEWKGLIVHSPSPGHFVLSGSLQTRKQAELVWEYLTRNFRYIDLLENKVIVEEDVVGSVLRDLLGIGINGVTVQISNGELLLTGAIPEGKKTDFEKLVLQFQTIPGVRAVRNLVSEKAPSEAVQNISDRYLVTGTSRVGEGKLNVVINGRILSTGDILDGMKITTINPSYVLLEKDGAMYRIDINR